MRLRIRRPTAIVAVEDVVGMVYGLGFRGFYMSYGLQLCWGGTYRVKYRRFRGTSSGIYSNFSPWGHVIKGHMYGCVQECI